MLPLVCISFTAFFFPVKSGKTDFLLNLAKLVGFFFEVATWQEGKNEREYNARNYNYDCLNDMICIHFSDYNKQGINNVICSNDSCFFRLRVNERREWSLLEIRRLSSNPAPEPRKSFSEVFETTQAVDYIMLHELLLNHAFQIATINLSPLVCITHGKRKEIPHDGLYQFSCVLKTAANESYAYIVESRYTRYRNGLKEDYIVENTVSELETLPLLKKSITRLRKSESDVDINTEYTFTFRRHMNKTGISDWELNESFFQLSHFGLPNSLCDERLMVEEESDMKSRRVRAIILLFGCALTFALSIYIKRKYT